jgi:hypothetical protein
MESRFKSEGFIARLREAYGSLGVEVIAERLGINKQSIYKWGRGETEPELGRLLQVSSHTGYSIHWIATGEGEKRVSDGTIEYELDLVKIRREAVINYMIEQLRNLVNTGTDDERPSKHKQKTG